jgi:hypothetical protein
LPAGPSPEVSSRTGTVGATSRSMQNFSRAFTSHDGAVVEPDFSAENGPSEENCGYLCWYRELNWNFQPRLYSGLDCQCGAHQGHRTGKKPRNGHFRAWWRAESRLGRGAFFDRLALCRQLRRRDSCRRPEKPTPPALASEGASKSKEAFPSPNNSERLILPAGSQSSGGSAFCASALTMGRTCSNNFARLQPPRATLLSSTKSAARYGELTARAPYLTRPQKRQRRRWKPVAGL